MALEANVKGHGLSTAKYITPRSLAHAAFTTRTTRPLLARQPGDVSTSECSSLAPYWIPDGIRHYFVHRHSPNPEDEDDDSRGTDKALRDIGLERELPTDESSARLWWREWFSGVPQYVFLMIIVAATAVVLALLFGAVVAEFHSGEPGDGHVATVMVASPRDDLAGAAGHRPIADEIHGDFLVPVLQYEGGIGKEVQEITDASSIPATHEDMAAPDEMSIEDRGEKRTEAADSGDETTEVNKEELRAHKVYKFTDSSFDIIPNRGTKLACETTPVFTFCSGTSGEFFYDHARNVCMAATPNRLGVCNRGPNRFSSKENCWRRCIHGRTTAPECRLGALFGECHARDVAKTWWYSDGKRCRRWPFPNGRCPYGGSDVVFRTSADCARRCSHRTWRRPCRAPKRAACDSKHLRYPYYADVSSHDRGQMRCRQWSGNRVNYCLAGANRFPTLEACRKTCLWRYDVSQGLQTRA